MDDEIGDSKRKYDFDADKHSAPPAAIRARSDASSDPTNDHDHHYHYGSLCHFSHPILDDIGKSPNPFPNTGSGHAATASNVVVTPELQQPTRPSKTSDDLIREYIDTGGTKECFEGIAFLGFAYKDFATMMQDTDNLDTIIIPFLILSLMQKATQRGTQLLPMQCSTVYPGQICHIYSEEHIDPVTFYPRTFSMYGISVEPHRLVAHVKYYLVDQNKVAPKKGLQSAHL